MPDLPANQLASALARFPRYPLLEGPTPIQLLSRLSEQLGVAVYVKRDDLMGVGGGGNKLRKLEYLLGAALAGGADTIITVGGRQSNHARLTAAAAAHAGLACELVLTRSAARQDATYVDNGNVLLDELFGSTIHDLPAGADAQASAEARATELRGQGRNVFVAPLGGSSPLGCLGYAACAYEIAAQEQAMQLHFGRIVLANGSGGTQAGLAAGFTLLEGSAQRVEAYTVLAPLAQAQATTEQKAAQTLALLQEQSTASAPQIRVRGDQLGEGYGVPTPAMLAAVRLLAQTEGLLLDPVYSGKAFAGLLDDARTGQLRPGEPVLFLMTGGLPGLFAYRTAF